MFDASNVKVGDEVAYYSDSSVRVPQIVRISRETKTLFLISFKRTWNDETFEIKINKRDGWTPGDGYGRSFITNLTDELRACVDAQNLRRRLVSCSKKALELCERAHADDLVEAANIMGAAVQVLESAAARRARVPA